MKFEKKLLRLAEKSTHWKSKHAALIAKGNRILGFGKNVEGHHAEAMALLNASGKEVSGATLYTLMLKKNGRRGDATPCPNCNDAIRAAKLRRVIVYV